MGTYLEQLRRSRVGRFFAKYSADRADDGAILIAWQALFSLFPLLLGLLAIFGLILRDPGVSEQLVSAVTTQFPAQVTDLLGFMEETRELGGLLGIISVVGLLWTGSNLFGSMAQVFNRFFGAPERGFVWQKLMAVMMMAIFLLLGLLSVVSTGLTQAVVALADEIPGFRLQGFQSALTLALGYLLSFASAVLLFLAVYRVVPNRPLGFGDVWKGALLAAALFLLLNQVFPIYLSLFGGGFAAYKTFGLFLLLMTWFYFLARILVLGAELNAFLAGASLADEAEVSQTKTSKRAALTVDRSGRSAPAGKTLLWAGLTAGVTSLAIIAARQTAASIWRSLAGSEPPSR